MSLKIVGEPAVIDERILDRWGNEFKFDHVKGLAEWVKNSIDAYLREEFEADDSFVYVRFIPKKSGLTPQALQCIDFVGMTHDDIVKAFKRWGDPDAAGRKVKRVYGGHGNGGKFYMRQMFNTSRFVTYKHGRLSIFGFDPNKQYGFAEGYENIEVSVDEAMRIAEIESMPIPESVTTALQAGATGFTVVSGHELKKAQRHNSQNGIVSRLSVHPQARRILRYYPVYQISANDTPSRIVPESIEPKEGFEDVISHRVPEELIYDKIVLKMAGDGYEQGTLTLFTSKEPLSGYGEKSVLNCINIIGGVGCIASYRIHELGLVHSSAQSEFIYGECSCPILEDPEDDCVRNDREKLVDNERSRALLQWICAHVNSLADSMSQQAEAAEQAQNLEQSSAFNELLNRWKNKFMSKLYAEVFSGPGTGPGAGGDGGGGSRGEGTSKNVEGQGSTGEGEEGGGGDGDEPKKAPRFPLVLLSDFDADPLDASGGLVHCDPRHPPVYQRPEDVEAGIYWINTKAPFASRIVEQFGSQSARWRDYMFHRFVEIIIKQSIYQVARAKTDFSAASVDQLLDDIHKRVYLEAAENLHAFLFSDSAAVSSAEDL